MEIINTTRRKLETGTEIATRVYCLNDIIYKLVKIYDLPDYEQDKQEFFKLMKYLDEDIDFRELVKPTSILRVAEYGEIRYGYTMEYLTNHHTLEDELYMAPLELKKYYYYRIADILKKLHRINMAYDDIHENNIMIDKDTNRIRFVDPDSVKVFGININDLESKEIIEKKKFAGMVLSGLYETDMYDNYYIHMSDKIRELETTKEIREYIEELENGKNPEGFITDCKKDMSKDIITFNKKIITKGM